MLFLYSSGRNWPPNEKGRMWWSNLCPFACNPDRIDHPHAAFTRKSRRDYSGQGNDVETYLRPEESTINVNCVMPPNCWTNFQLPLSFFQFVANNTHRHSSLMSPVDHFLVNSTYVFLPWLLFAICQPAGLHVNPALDWVVSFSLCVVFPEYLKTLFTHLSVFDKCLFQTCPNFYVHFPFCVYLYSSTFIN